MFQVCGYSKLFVTFFSGKFGDRLCKYLYAFDKICIMLHVTLIKISCLYNLRDGMHLSLEIRG